MPIAVSLLLVVFFLAMNAFFVIAEFALVRVRKSQLEVAVSEGKRGARNALTMAESVNDYLSACQLGITLASLALGWLGEPAFAQLIRPLCQLCNMPPAAVSAIAIAIGYLIMTALHVVAGELIPKSFAIYSTEKYALRTATPLLWFYKITYPVMWLFNSTCSGVMKLFGHDTASEREVYTEEEIQLLIDESTESGLIDPEQNEYVDNIFDMGEKDAEAIMTSRTDMICLDTEDPIEENLAIMCQYKYTRYPVCEGSKDRIVGFVHVKDVFSALDPTRFAAGSRDLLPAGFELPIRPIEAVPGSLSLAKMLQVFQERHTEIAVVVDEHGGTDGIVTMSDIMEQIVGRSDDEYRHDAGEEIVQLKDGTYLVDGSLQISEFADLVAFETEEMGDCETVAGLALILFDRIPREGDSTVLAHHAIDPENPDEPAVVTEAELTVVDMDRLRIDKLSVKISQHPAES